MNFSPQEMAKDILLRYWDGSLPVNPVTIAKQLDLKVIYGGDDLELSGSFDDKTNTIFVNEDDSLNKQRFTIAHEIGHAVLGHGSSPRTKIRYNQTNFQFKEYEANLFAAELLMPIEAINYMIKQTEISLKEMAEVFSVSNQALEIRLKRLGYLL